MEYHTLSTLSIVSICLFVKIQICSHLTWAIQGSIVKCSSGWYNRWGMQKVFCVFIWLQTRAWPSQLSSFTERSSEWRQNISKLISRSILKNYTRWLRHSLKKWLKISGRYTSGNYRSCPSGSWKISTSIWTTSALSLCWVGKTSSWSPKAMIWCSLGC